MLTARARNDGNVVRVKPKSRKLKVVARAPLSDEQLETAARLKRLREETRMSSRKFAQQHGFHVQVYYTHETGQRGFSLETAAEYAESLCVPVHYILFGNASGMTDNEAHAQAAKSAELLPRRRVVPIVGTISSALARVSRLPEGSVAGYVPIDPERLEYLIVVGDDVPVGFFVGSKVGHDPHKGFTPDKVDGHLCCCKCEGGVEIIRICHLQANGLWTLKLPHATNHDNTLRDVHLLAAGRVRRIDLKD